MALPRGEMGLSAVCDCGIPDHTHFLFWLLSALRRGSVVADSLFIVAPIDCEGFVLSHVVLSLFPALQSSRWLLC